MALGVATRSLLDFLLPQHCTICSRPSDQWLCGDCHHEFERITNEASCGTCAAPLPDDLSPCPRCLGRPGRVIRRAAALGRHDGPLRELIHHLKYHHRWSLADTLAQQYPARPHAMDLLRMSEVVVPVPLHWWRRLRRGYNQAELLARAIAKLHQLELCHALTRHRGTHQQTSLKSISARARNVRGVFSPTRHIHSIVGKRVLLIDDVLTTQATLRAAARILHSAKPARIDVLVLAVADPANRDFTTVASPSTGTVSQADPSDQSQ